MPTFKDANVAKGPQNHGIVHASTQHKQGMWNLHYSSVVAVGLYLFLKTCLHISMHQKHASGGYTFISCQGEINN